MLDAIRNLFTDRRFLRTDRGASAVEYGLLVAGIAAVVIAGVFFLGGTVRGAFDDTKDCIESDGAGATCTTPAEGGGDEG